MYFCMVTVYTLPKNKPTMPKKIGIIIFFITLLFAYFNIANNPSNPIPQTEESSETKLIPNDYFYQQRTYPYGKIDKSAYQKAFTYRLKNKPSKAEKRQNNWQFAGPTNVGGRVTDIEMFADDLNTIFVGAASGGIFKSNDEGNNWQPIFDDAASLSIGDMAIGADRTIYVGTGEANAGGGSLAYDGVGVYKSKDEGANWEWKGLEKVGSIGKVVVNPQNSDEVFVASMGYLFENNQERGVYRSRDGGDNWEQVFFRSDSTGAIDLVMHPQNPSIIYAAMWERIRRPNNRQYGGETSGVFKSMDGGDTWTELTNGLPTANSQKGRIGLAIAPSNPNVLMAVYANTFGDLQGIYKTTNGGNNWTQMGAIGSVPFMWWFGKITIDPTNINKVFAPGFLLERSTDGGENFNVVGANMHVDQHSVFIHPMNTDVVVAGNDGGVYISETGGNSFVKKNNLPITQYYALEIDNLNPERLYGGTQDNGTNRTLSGNLNDWEMLFFGDGFRVIVDPTNSQRIYGESQRGNLLRSVDGGTSFLSALNGIERNDRNNWNTPIAIDPNQTNILYYGTQRVYQSTNNAQSWRAISPDLSNGAIAGNLAFGTTTTIDVSPVNGNIIYVGTDDGNVWNTVDGGENWTKISNDLPNRWVTSVATDPLESTKAYVIFSGYRFGENIGHVYRTNNNGQTWQDLSNNLPDIPLNDLVINPQNADQLFLASDIGVFESQNAGSDWTLLSENLPNVPVTDLDFHDPTQTLVAATYGRGLYRYSLGNTTSVNEIKTKLSLSATIYPNPATDFLIINLNLTNRSNITIQLVDLNGKILKSIDNQAITAGETQLEVPILDLPKAAYLCVIKSDTGEVMTRKVVVL